jgi:hypothetical protein
MLATAQVNNTQHDLGGGGLGQNAGTGLLGSTGVCVFCHTPHGSDNAAPVPLWNKVLPVGTAYTMYSTLNTPSLDGTEAPMATSPSLACLSCHDGGQAMDVVLNAPGSGGYNAGGAQMDPAPGAVDAMTGTPIPNLGTDLTDDHPISIQYAGGGLSSATPVLAVGATTDPDFQAAGHTTLNGNDIWWVDSPVGVGGTREKTDMALFTRNDSGTIEPYVECGSCHDPHTANAVANVSPNFMRISNTDSRVCLTCHIK